MAAKKPAKKSMGKKAMKKTKGGAVDAFMPAPTQGQGLLLPAVQKVREAAISPSSFQSFQQ